MPISDEDKRKREEARVAYATEEEIKNNEKLVKVIDATIKRRQAELAVLQAKVTLSTNEKKQVDDLNKSLTDLAERHKNVTDALDTNLKSLQDNLKAMKEADTATSKFLKKWDEYSQKALVVAKSVDSLLKAHHGYNLEIQKITDLTGRFTRNTQGGIEAFNKMRTALNLTRQEGVEFGKVWAEVSRMGIDPSKFVKATEQLQKAFGQKGGIAAATTFVRTKASASVLEAAAGGDKGAIVKAMRSAEGMDQAYQVGGLLGGPRGAGAARAARFEATQARVSKVKDDIQAGMAAALDLGMGPEMGALALPLAELNANVQKITNKIVGSDGWWKKTFGGGGGGGAGGGGGGGAGGGGGGGDEVGFWKGTGRLVAAGLIAAGGMYAGTTLRSAGKQEPEGWKRTAFESGGRMVQAGSIGAAKGMVEGGIGGAIKQGAMATAIGGVVATFESWGKTWSDQAVAWKDAADSWVSTMIDTEEAIKANELQDSLIALESNAEGVGKALAGLAGTVAKLPENIENAIAQSRAAHAMQSLDPKPAEELMRKSTAAYTASVNESSGEWSKQLGRLGIDMVNFEKKYEAAKKFQPGSAEEKAAKEARDTARGKLAEKQMEVSKQQEAMGQIPAARQQMEVYTTQESQRALETQAATTKYEREYAGTGNVEQMKKITDTVNAAHQADLELMNKKAADAEVILQLQIKTNENLALQVGEHDPMYANYKYQADITRDELAQMKRVNALKAEQKIAENQRFTIEKAMEQAMAATETVTFKKSQRAMALAKAQESFTRERGGSPQEITRYAGAQAKEAQTQLDEFMKSFKDNMADLEQKLKAPNLTAVERMKIEMKIKDVVDEKLKLEQQGFDAQIRQATAGEQYRQELLGASKRISEIQRDTAADLGMSWRVQMAYQADIIRIGQADVESKRKEVEEVARIGRENNINPEENLRLLKANAEYLQAQGQLSKDIIGKQRSFLEKSTAASFGMGSGSKISPILNPRMFGEMVMGATGLKQAAGLGGRPMTMEEQQKARMKGLKPLNIFGGIGGGLPAPGAPPGLAPGEKIPGGGPGAPGVPAPGGAPGAEAAAGKAAGGQDISGRIEIALVDNILETRVVRIVRNMNLNGANG